MIEFISLDVRNVEISKDEHLTDVFQRNNFPLNAIPGNCILDKALHGESGYRWFIE